MLDNFTAEKVYPTNTQSTSSDASHTADLAATIALDEDFDFFL